MRIAAILLTFVALGGSSAHAEPLPPGWVPIPPEVETLTGLMVAINRRSTRAINELTAIVSLRRGGCSATAKDAAALINDAFAEMKEMNARLDAAFAVATPETRIRAFNLMRGRTFGDSLDLAATAKARETAFRSFTRACPKTAPRLRRLTASVPQPKLPSRGGSP